MGHVATPAESSSLDRARRDEIRRTRRHPRRTQPDYLVLRYLVNNLERVLGDVRHPVNDVLDVWAGTQPYRDMLPPHIRYVALDVDDTYGVPDVLSKEFLPLPPSSFDLVLFTEAFQHVADPVAAVAELRRVLRPGGTVVLSVSLVWEYDRRCVEHRFTGPGLKALFQDGWEDVRLYENGGYSVAWATLTGRILRGFGEFGPPAARRALRPLLKPAAWVLNVIATALAHAEARWHTAPFVLPMGLLIVARRADG